MATDTSFCPSCGIPIQRGAAYCANCGTKITTTTFSTTNVPSYYLGTPVQRPAVSTGPYKAVIAVLLIIIVLLGVGYYTAASGHLFSLGTYHYQLANPPNLQSTLPKPAPTGGSYQDQIWNACNGPPSAGCSMTSRGWREGSVPDTFDYYVAFTSTVNVTVYFFTMGQFVQFSVCNGDVGCVSGSYDSINATTSVPRYMLFTLGEGCADYLAIYVASGTGVMYPDVGVSRPAILPNSPTGYCAQAGS